MNVWRHIILCISFLTVLTAGAQDIHFSQFFNVPGNYNPAETGLFDGDFRGISVYRSQWRTVTVPFTTFGIMGDANKLIPKQPIGTGISLFRDQAGDGKFTTTQLNLSGSYIIPALTDSTQFVSVGLQMGITSKRVDFSAFDWGNQFNGVQYDAGLSSGEDFVQDRNTVFDFHLGAVYDKILNEKWHLKTGLSVFNISTQNQSFTGGKDPLFARLNFQARADYNYSEKLTISPALNVSGQGKFRELMLGGYASYDLTEPKGVKQAVGAGAFFRSGDAGYIYFDFIYDQWRLGTSYDFNFSDLRIASNGRGGLELTLTYIFKKFRPRIIGGRVCPDFI